MYNDLKIIEGCKKRKRKAQKLLFERYSPVLFPICLRYAKNKQEAEDVLQDGFIKIFSNIEQYSEKGSFEGWLKRIIINTAIANYKQNYKYYFHDNVDKLDVKDNIEIDEPDFDYSLQDLMKIINDLPDGYRVIFNMAVIEGYKHKEISEILDIGTSKSQLSRAKKMLQKQLIELNKDKKRVFVRIND